MVLSAATLSSAKPAASLARMRSLGAAHRLADRQARPPHPARGEQRRELGRRRLVPRKGEDARSRLQVRQDRLERPTVQRQRRAVLLAPAEPGGGEREGRGRRNAERFARRKAPHQHRSDAEKERIAARQHADGPPAAGLDQVERAFDRRGPGDGLGGEIAGEREMAPATDDEFGLREKRARGRRKAVDPVLADPDQGEPFLAALFVGHGAAS